MKLNEIDDPFTPIAAVGKPSKPEQLLDLYRTVRSKSWSYPFEISMYSFETEICFELTGKLSDFYNLFHLPPARQSTISEIHKDPFTSSALKSQRALIEPVIQSFQQIISRWAPKNLDVFVGVDHYITDKKDPTINCRFGVTLDSKTKKRDLNHWATLANRPDLISP